MGAIVLDDCIIESDSIVAAGAVLTIGTQVKSGEIFAGVPAKKVKEGNYKTGQKHGLWINFNKEGLCPSISKKKDIKPVVQSLLFDSSEIKKSLKMYDKSMHRFNGPNDGKAVKRIAEALIGKT